MKNKVGVGDFPRRADQVRMIAQNPDRAAPAKIPLKHDHGVM
jgi:hypothetical protein